MMGVNYRRALTALPLVLLLACGRATETAPDVPMALQTPWQQRDFSGHEFRHSLTDGIAVDPAGKFVVIALGGRPINELAVFDLVAQTGFVLKGPDERVLLAQPAISPDGGEIAVVATPLAGFGVGEIWIIDRETGRAEVFGDPGRSYRQPAFSPDGSQIAYFRDIEETRWRPGFMRPEYRNFLPYALFQRRRGAAAETQLTTQPFLSVCELAYDATNQGLFFCALDPLRRDRLGGGDEVWALPRRDTSESQTRESPNYFVAWGGAPEARVFPPPNLQRTHGIRLVGALSNGGVFLKAVLETHENGELGFAAVGAAFDGRRSRIVFSPQGLESAEGNLASSSDGMVIAAMRYIASPDRSQLLPILIIQDHGVVREIDVVEVYPELELLIHPERGDALNGRL